MIAIAALRATVVPNVGPTLSLEKPSARDAELLAGGVLEPLDAAGPSSAVLIWIDVRAELLVLDLLDLRVGEAERRDRARARPRRWPACTRLAVTRVPLSKSMPKLRLLGRHRDRADRAGCIPDIAKK